ncbi:MAG: 16S rRNA (cytidine(1402)-2'-O)-methyltransferase [Hydrogenophilales bacterium]|nr:16S rRNA (cytidine(1402)-2'-O)-methyltransferase [Hydrogenophilales bacterium]
MKDGLLYVVATPIGNLGDITLRALEVLKQVDLIAAEDTRVTGNLLKHFGVAAKLISVREHNEQAGALKIIDALRAGHNVALATDAGTPAVSDPGARVVAAVRAAGLSVMPIPGANAAVAALSAAGFNTPHFLFYGFLPAKGGERRTALQALLALPYTLVFYEAPHRVADTVADLVTVFGGEREIVFARELTKTFEEIHNCALSEAVAWISADANRERGEYVLIVSGAAEQEKSAVETQRVLEVLLSELPVKQAAKLAAQITGAKKNQLYELALKLRGND